MAPAKDPAVRLRHMLEHIDGIVGATRHRADGDILANYLIRRAIERAVEIISEAAKSLPAELRESEPEVPWREIIGIGNLLRHEYYRIKDADMLDILRVHLPRLRPAVVRMLNQIEGRGAGETTAHS